MSSMRPRSASWSVDSPHSGRASAATSSYCASRSRHAGWSASKSAMTRLTRGRVRLASARVKYFRGTGLIYAEMQRLDAHVLFPDDHNALNEFWMGDEPHHSFIPVHHHDGRSNVRVFFIEPFDPVSLQLRIQRHHFRILPRMCLRLARLRVVSRRHASRHAVAVGDRAQIAPV